VWFVLLKLIPWIAIYLMDSIIQSLNNWGLKDGIMSPLPNQHSVGLATESMKQDETFDYCCDPLP